MVNPPSSPSALASDHIQPDNTSSGHSAHDQNSPQNQHSAHYQSSSAEPPYASTPPPSLPSESTGLEPADSKSPAHHWEVNQDLNNIKRFAQFFNGQIVDLDDDLAAPPSGMEPQKPSAPGSDPGPDVPF
ncbi:MAG: hypothetical protein HC800_00615 [Phormidesmis sp. RL_2_1]|nr:hypothetical protein [Phormidesmis sp. RL_2_1]